MLVEFYLEYQNPILLVGCLLAGMLLASVCWSIVSRRRTLERFEEGLQQGNQTYVAAAEQWQALQAELNATIHTHSRDVALAQAEGHSLQERIKELTLELDAKRDQLSTAKSNVAASDAHLQAAQKSFEERELLFRETSEQLKKEFELLANRVFAAQEDKQQARLQTVLTPFKDQIVDFRKRVDEVYHTDAKERASLLGEIKNLQRASDRINEEAENLTKALKGDKKLQGNWGELVLERVLEESGLRKDHEYFLQTSLRNESGALKRPDVLIRLPENKDVVVDSKVSLNAYEEALASEDDSEREKKIRQHLVNLRGHVKRLSEQDYDQLPDVRSLDFVLMFVPIESAFTLAMESDPRLFTDAFTSRIVIVSPTTLMMTLRIINNVWRYEKQNRNAMEISRRAGALYDKLRGLVEEMEVLGKQLGTAGKTYESVYARLTTGKGNLVRQAEKFRELGADVKKPLATNLVEKAQEDQSDDGTAN